MLYAGDCSWSLGSLGGESTYARTKSWYKKPIYFVNADFGNVDTSEILDNTQSPYSTENELSIDMLYAGEFNWS